MEKSDVLVICLWIAPNEVLSSVQRCQGFLHFTQIYYIVWDIDPSISVVGVELITPIFSILEAAPISLFHLLRAHLTC